jgi:hypothetical protein
MTAALFDWDAFLYRAAFATQKVKRHVTVEGEDRTSSFDSAADMKGWLEEEGLTRDDINIEEEIVLKPAGHAVTIMKALLKKNMADVNATSAELYITGKDNFRHHLYAQYKANRTRPKPVHLQAVTDYSINKLGAEVIDGMEADDMLAIRATQLSEAGREWVIVSPDKDLLTVAGTHWSPWKETCLIVDPLEAHYNFYSQLLTGDTSDNIPGIRGMGPKGADKLLGDCLEEIDMYNVVVEQYEANGIPPKNLVRNGRLLHMLRHETDLWEPPNDR